MSQTVYLRASEILKHFGQRDPDHRRKQRRPCRWTQRRMDPRMSGDHQRNLVPTVHAGRATLYVDSILQQRQPSLENPHHFKGGGMLRSIFIFASYFERRRRRREEGEDEGSTATATTGFSFSAPFLPKTERLPRTFNGGNRPG